MAWTQPGHAKDSATENVGVTGRRDQGPRVARRLRATEPRCRSGPLTSGLSGRREPLFSSSLFARVSAAMAWLASELVQGPRASPQRGRPESVRLVHMPPLGQLGLRCRNAAAGRLKLRLVFPTVLRAGRPRPGCQRGGVTGLHTALPGCAFAGWDGDLLSLNKGAEAGMGSPAMTSSKPNPPKGPSSQHRHSGRLRLQHRHWGWGRQTVSSRCVGQTEPSGQPGHRPARSGHVRGRPAEEAFALTACPSVYAPESPRPEGR